METIKIIKCGPVDDHIVDAVKRELALVFGHVVAAGDDLSAPESAYDCGRIQYSAPKFLDRLHIRTNDSIKVLCITTVDLYLPGLNHVFGLTDEFRPLALVSTARLGKEKERATERAVKTSIHELGHIHGLRHCKDHKCVMFFSYTLADTDYKSKEFCSSCRNVLEQKNRICLTAKGGI